MQCNQMYQFEPQCRTSSIASTFSNVAVWLHCTSKFQTVHQHQSLTFQWYLPEVCVAWSLGGKKVMTAYCLVYDGCSFSWKLDYLVIWCVYHLLDCSTCMEEWRLCNSAWCVECLSFSLIFWPDHLHPPYCIQSCTFYAFMRSVLFEKL